MFEEQIKRIHGLLVKFTSSISNRSIIENRVIYISSFPQAHNLWLKKLAKTNNVDITVFYFTENFSQIKELQKLGVKCCKVSNNLTFIFKYIPFITKSKIILVDNYLALLADLNKNTETEVIQIWHANGAIKKFGMESKTVLTRYSSAIDRFKRVYNSIDTYVVASEEMKYVFEKSYLANGKKFLFYGYNQFDQLLCQEYLQNQKREIEQTIPQIKDKKVILYAPTYREKNMEFTGLNIEELSNSINSEWHILVKYHPYMKVNNTHSYSNVTYLNSKYPNLDYFICADCLIADYSSIIYSFAMLKKEKKLFIYANDLEEYDNLVGVNEWFYDFYNDNKVVDTFDIVNKLNNDKYFDTHTFNTTWNKYNNGDSSNKLIEYINNAITK